MIILKHEAKGATGIGSSGCGFMDSSFFEWKIQQELSELEEKLDSLCDKIYLLQDKREIETDPEVRKKLTAKIHLLNTRRNTISNRIKVCYSHLEQIRKTGTFTE